MDDRQKGLERLSKKDLIELVLIEETRARTCEEAVNGSYSEIKRLEDLVLELQTALSGARRSRKRLLLYILSSAQFLSEELMDAATNIKVGPIPGSDVVKGRR